MLKLLHATYLMQQTTFNQIDESFFYNGVTGDYVLTIEGKCAFEAVSERKVDVTCKTSDTEFKKHSLGISDNVTYFSEQLNSKGVSTYQYKVDFRPSVIIPDVDLKLPK